MNRDYLLDCLAYNHVSGELTWKKRPRSHFSTDRGYNTFYSQKVGRKTGCRSETKDGLFYLKVAINKKLYLAHRLAWIIYHGEIPAGMEIDHIDHNGENNAIDNLRLVTSSENKQNRTMVSTNKSGKMGVYHSRKTGRWVAEIFVNNERYGLGSFNSIDDAIAAREKAELEFNFHNNHGGEKIERC